MKYGISATVGFLSTLCGERMPKRQHRVDEAPTPEVEYETRYHVLGDHLSKTTGTDFRDELWRKSGGRIAKVP